MMGKRGDHTLLLCWERAAAAAPEEEPWPERRELAEEPDLAEESLRGESSSLSQSVNWSDWLAPLSLLSLFPSLPVPNFCNSRLNLGFPLRCSLFLLELARAS
jgi:hypothetical protein